MKNPYKILRIVKYPVLVIEEDKFKRMLLNLLLFITVIASQGGKHDSEIARKTLKKQQVLKDITMRVPQNCVYGLLGPNGAGKSTLLKMLAGMLKKDEGEIRFRGHEFERKDLREIGSLIETPPIYENLTARENMEVRALMLGVPMEEIQGTLETAGISDTGRKKAGVYSLGMKQRLELPWLS